MELNLKNYAHIGDAVWEVFIREKVIYKTQNQKTMHKLTIEKVNGEFQMKILNNLMEFLTDEEKELVRRAKNLPTSNARKISHEIHSYATALEVIIGYYYINDKDRLNELYKIIEDNFLN